MWNLCKCFKRQKKRLWFLVGRFFTSILGTDRALTNVTILLLYFVAATSFTVAVLGSSEWTSGAVSRVFLVAGVLIPFVTVAFAFAVQILSLSRDARDRQARLEQEVRFLGALHRCQGGPVIRRVFLAHLLDEWDVSMGKLQQGVITIQEKYWHVCSQLFDIARQSVECTSTVPLEYWDINSPNKNEELLAYKELQRTTLVDPLGIPVSRTFILNDYSDDSQVQLFFDIAIRQLNEGFRIYYVLLNECEEDLRSVLLSDLSLIDDTIFMLGRVVQSNRSVYCYEFFDLSSAGGNDKLFEPVLRLCSNPGDVRSGHPPKLMVTQHRKNVNEFPRLSEAKYLNEQKAIEALVQDLKY